MLRYSILNDTAFKQANQFVAKWCAVKAYLQICDGSLTKKSDVSLMTVKSSGKDRGEVCPAMFFAPAFCVAKGVLLTWRPRWCKRWRRPLPHERWVARSGRRCFWTHPWLWVCAADLATGKALWPELLMSLRSLDGEEREEGGEGRNQSRERMGAHIWFALCNPANVDGTFAS